MEIKEFDEIRPYEEGEMKQAFEELINDRQFSMLLKGFVPWLPKSVRNGLLRLAFIGVKTPLDFQLRFMKPVVWYFIRKYTDGLTFEDSPLSTLHSPLSTLHSPLSTQNSPLTSRYTFVSNHRDIVLDSAFLDVMLNKNGYPTTVEIGIGDNLLIYPWIKRLVRMNKAFTVRRGLTAHEMMRSSQLMSSYIHYAVTQKKENIWIAQREGRAKDSDDRTQESVLKMLAMGGSLKDLNIVPLTISYEYDPCDYLKAQEFQQKRDNPNFKKSKQDDLDNMKTGIFGYKGRVHYQCGTPVNEWIDELQNLPKNEFFKAVAQRMDQEIHRNYHLYPCNYIALDILNSVECRGESVEFATALEGKADTTAAANSPLSTLNSPLKTIPSPLSPHYTPSDVTRFEEYLSAQLAKIKIPNKDEAFLRERMLTMYANPLRNYLAAHE